MYKMKRRNGFVVFLLVVLWGLAGDAMSATRTPTTVAELALYQGTDRQQILEGGANKEGKLLFYTPEVMEGAVRPILNAFQKKYPYIKVDVWRADIPALLPRIVEEYGAGKYLVDVISGSPKLYAVLQKAAILQPFYSPNFNYIPDDGITKAPGQGAFRVAFREHGIGLGYNTKLMNREQVPKTYKDLLNPKWKGKIPISAGGTTHNWLFAMASAHGDEFVKQVARQDFIVQNVSARALLDMIIYGEYAFSPTIFSSQVINSREQGAPCEWVPLEPVFINIGELALPRQAPNPHAALLFLDFRLTKEAAEIYRKTGYNPTRKDVPGTATYKKFYGEENIDQLKKWEDVFRRFFIEKQG